MKENLNKIKYKFYFIVSLLWLLTSYNASAQQINIDWGSLHKKQNKTYITDFVGNDGTSFFIVRKKNASLFSSAKIFIEKYDALSLKIRYSKELQLPKTKDKKHQFEKLILLNNTLVLFTSYYDSSTDKNKAFAWKLTENASVIPKEVLVDEIEAPKKNNSGSFDFIVSPNAKKVLVYHNKPYKKNNTEKFACSFLNDTLGIEFKKSFELPYKDKESFIKEYKIDDDGNIGLLARVTIEGEDKKSKQKFYSLLYISKSSETLKEFKLDLGIKKVSAVTFSFANNGNVIAAGFYSYLGRSEQEIAGAFYLKIDNEINQIVNNNTKDFDREFLSEFISQQRIDKKRELQDFLLKSIRILPNGSTILLAEQYEENTVCYSDMRTGMLNCTYYYYYNDIIAIKFNEMGMFEWSKHIPKEQLSVNDRGTYSSFIVTDYDNQVYIIFNDHPSNLLQKGNSFNPRTMDNPKRSVTAMVVLAQNGEMAKVKLFKSADEKIYISPRLYGNLNQSELIIYGQKNSNYKFGRISFQ